jgi:hypothetical protein
MPGIAGWVIPRGGIPPAENGGIWSIGGAEEAAIPAPGPPIMPMLMRFLRRSSVAIGMADGGGEMPAGAAIGACTYTC